MVKANKNIFLTSLLAVILLGVEGFSVLAADKKSPHHFPPENQPDCTACHTGAYFSRKAAEAKKAKAARIAAEKKARAEAKKRARAKRLAARKRAEKERKAARIARRKGCLSCHEGIETINKRMQPFLLMAAKQLYGKEQGYECAICHEGKPSAPAKQEAHKGMLPNPASLWVLHQGKGCARCHDRPGSITTLQGRPLKKPVGGNLIPMRVPLNDPAEGDFGIDYTYRMARALMSLETGKANKTLSSNGIIPKGTFPYADYDMDDPDGAVPRMGSETYKAWIKKALEAGYIKRLDKVKEIPDLEQGTRVFGSREKAGLSDMYRKQCGRCHVWGEGRDKRGDLRASGCAACHMLYGNDGLYEGGDPTIPQKKAKRPYPLKHKITLAIPAAQCSHCHTRGKRIGTTFMGLMEYDYVKDKKAPPYDKKGDPQEPLYTKEYMNIRPDVHLEAGMNCVDCHTSIDVHGDGNIYPVTFYQVEILCYDCHGTPDKYPWELAVGYGTPVTLEGERGFKKFQGKEYLLTSRGNIRRNWIKEGNQAYIINRLTGKKQEIPILKTITDEDNYASKQGKVAMAVVHQHIEKLECYACHATWAPQCYGCHIKYDVNKQGTDWVSTGKNPQPGRQTIVRKPGDIAIENRAFFRWESPILGKNFRGKVTPLIPGCQVFYTMVDKKGRLKTLNKFYRTSTGHNSPTLAPLQPHSNTLVSRTCEDCHTTPKAIGYGTGNSRPAGEIQGDEPLFTDLSAGAYGDIPGAKTGKAQIPKIKNFPYALDQLVTRNGKQVQNMPLPRDRSLSDQERNLVEREGTCIACHQYYNTRDWDKIIKKYGKADTPDKHDEMMSKALLNLIKEP
ncbi:MAG: hypothetical protein ACE5GM_01480 [bacterium]